MLRPVLITDDEIHEVQAQLVNPLRQAGITAVVLDFVTVQEISTTAIAFLFKLQARLRKVGLRHMFCGLSHDKIVAAANDRFAYEVFKVLDIDHLLALTEAAGHGAVHAVAGQDTSDRTALAC